MNNITAPNYFSWSPKSSYQLILNISTYLYCKHLHFDFESSFLVYGATWGSPFIPFLKKIGAKFYMKTVTSRTLRHAFKLSRVAKWEWNKFNANITFIQICIYYLLTTGGDWVKQVKNKLASIICLTCQRRRERELITYKLCIHVGIGCHKCACARLLCCCGFIFSCNGAYGFAKNKSSILPLKVVWDFTRFFFSLCSNTKWLLDGCCHTGCFIREMLGWWTFFSCQFTMCS